METQMYALFAVSVASTSYMSPDMVGEPSEDRDSLVQEGKRLTKANDERGSYGTAYWVYPVKQQTVWVRV